MFNKKLTLESVKGQLETVIGNFGKVREQASAEMEIIEDKRKELDRQKEYQMEQFTGADIAASNFTKLLSEKI